MIDCILVYVDAIQQYTLPLVDNVPEIINDLLIAGVETTNTTLRFFVFYMCKYPDIQKKCREEILEVSQQLYLYIYIYIYI